MKKDEFLAQGGMISGEESSADGLTSEGESGIIRDKRITEAVKNGDITLALNPEKQNRHIEGTAEYVKGKSRLTISKGEAQEIINEKAGTGELVFSKSGEWKRKEKITCDNIIGVDVSPATGEEAPTNLGTIHYSKTGSHLVPRRK